jgi:hypothetical protein
LTNNIVWFLKHLHHARDSGWAPNNMSGNFPPHVSAESLISKVLVP